jgi:hypothetical protein
MRINPTCAIDVVDIPYIKLLYIYKEFSSLTNVDIVVKFPQNP